MRLCRPTLHIDSSLLKFDLCDLLFGEDLFDNSVAASHLPRLMDSISIGQSNNNSTDPSDLSYRNRFLLHRPSDSLGLPGFLWKKFGWHDSPPMRCNSRREAIEKMHAIS
ncbi:hypothetical protein Fot_06199 [Forsythia ovata]|uniref:Uncharacterized protein n=1 Tax=Forsythia ovata TaxID=205694 RepID=A0ABD1WSZ5_9LAMI